MNGRAWPSISAFNQPPSKSASFIPPYMIPEYNNHPKTSSWLYLAVFSQCTFTALMILVNFFPSVTQFVLITKGFSFAFFGGVNAE